MSDVISFRLNENNPREEKARRVVKAWFERGYRLRYIMTEALLCLGEKPGLSAEKTTLEEVNDKLTQISRILERIGNRKSLIVENKGEKPEESELTAGFLGVINQAAKPGLRCG